MAWRCRFLTARRNQRSPDALIDFHTGALRVRFGVLWVARGLLVVVDSPLEGSTARASRALRAARPAILLGRLHFEESGAFDRSVSVVVEID